MNFRRKKCAARAASSVISRLLTRAVIGTLILSFNGPALAGDAAEQIAERIGPLWPRAADVLALVASGAIVSRYFEEFNYSDALPDKDWNIVVERLTALSERAPVRVIPLAKERENEFQRNFVKELRRMPADDLARLATFINSEAGTNWLLANRQFEKSLYQIGVRAGAYAIASPRRARTLIETNPPPDVGRQYHVPIFLMPEVLQGGARSTPAVFFLAQYVALMKDMDASKKVDAAYLLAKKSATEGRLSEHLFRDLAAALGTAIREGLGDINLQSIFGKSMAEEFENRIRGLARRAFFAADATKTGRCKNVPRLFRVEDVEKIASGNSPIKPGSYQHEWLALAFEYGCDVKQDFAMALRVRTDMANAGSTGSLCVLSNWHRLGVGTKPDTRAAEKWEQKYNAVAHGRPCQQMDINPQHPWAGMDDR